MGVRIHRHADILKPSCCINQAEFQGDANKNQRNLQVDVGIRGEICLIDANIGLQFPRHQVKKG
ncbi:MAG: hypothetical protein UF438_07015 [Oribacterium sp.]|nr:hypothetical protein [Oribacterium sp.]